MQQPTPLPSATPTPISTPLPPIPTQPPPGSDDNPIAVVLRPALNGASARTANNRIADELSTRTGLNIEVLTVETDAEALAAVCDSVGGAVNVAFVGGLTAAAAEAQGCGTAILWGKRGTGRQVRTAEPIYLFARAEGNYTTVASLADDPVFCRVSFNDVVTWLTPTLILEAEGVDPLRLTEMRTVDDMRDLMESVASGECDAAGILSSVYDAADAETRAALTVLAESAPIPYSVLVYPVEMALTERTALEIALLDLMADNDARAPLRDQLGVNAFERVDADVLDDLKAFIEAAGVDLSRMDG